MADLKSWYEKRSVSTVSKSQPTDIVKYLEETLGKEQKDLFVANALSKFDKEVLAYVIDKNNDEAFLDLFGIITNRNHRNKLIKSESQFINDYIYNKLAKNWVTVINSDYSLADLIKMATDPKDWSRITKKHDQIANDDIVDHTYHTDNIKAPEEYTAALEAPEKIKANKNINNGISAKMIHKIGDNHYMAKPYHKKIESGTRSWVKHPITGWATMATKKLYDAANIGHLCEDVTTHTHQNTPLTVHKFAKDSTIVGEKYNEINNNHYSFNPYDLHKIAVMDFLTNNIDRHSGNLVIPTTVDQYNEDGYNPVMAIDHERSFQYHKPIVKKNSSSSLSESSNRSDENPYHYLDRNPALSLLSRNTVGSDHLEEMGHWWKENSQNVKDTFNKELLGIKDESVRSHIRNNFHARAEYMDKLAQNYEDGEQQPITRVLKEAPGVRMQQYHNPHALRASSLVKKLPHDTKEAFMAVNQWIRNKPKANYNARNTVEHALRQKLSKLNNVDLIDTFLHSVQNPHYSKTNKSQAELDLMPTKFIPNYVLDSNNLELKQQFREALEKIENKNPSVEHLLYRLKRD